MTTGGLLVYGATGYTGELVARRAVERGLCPVVAGRSESRLAPLAGELALPRRAFPLEAPALAAGLEGVGVVLHCAGPFARTSRPMAEACLARGVHYLDITGEVGVFEALAARDAEARRRGVMLLPGVGFDVVPSDCLAAHVASRLPGATSLRLAILALGGGFSRGTLTTVAEGVHLGGAVRRNGVLTPVPPGAKTRLVDFGRGKRPAVLIPWGDLATAFRSTGIPNIEVYMAARWGVRAALRLSGVLGGLLASGPAQAFLKRRIQAGPAGPTAEQRARGRSVLWAEAEDPEGRIVTSRLQTPEAYRLTADSAVAIAERVLRGELTPGFQTPSLAYGKDFVLTLEGVSREDVGADGL